MKLLQNPDYWGCNSIRQTLFLYRLRKLTGLILLMSWILIFFHPNFVISAPSSLLSVYQCGISLSLFKIRAQYFFSPVILFLFLLTFIGCYFSFYLKVEKSSVLFFSLFFVIFLSLFNICSWFTILFYQSGPFSPFLIESGY